MPSLRRRNRPNRVRSPSIRSATVTKRNSSPGRARRKPLKPLRGESRVISGVLVVTTVCLLPMHTGCGCSGHPAFPAPSSYEGQCSCKPRANHAARRRRCARIEHQCPSQTRSSSSAHAGDPVFQRRRCWKREAAAYCIPRRSLSSGAHSRAPLAGYDGLLFCWRAEALAKASSRATTTGEWLFDGWPCSSSMGRNHRLDSLIGVATDQTAANATFLRCRASRI